MNKVVSKFSKTGLFAHSSASRWDWLDSFWIRLQQVTTPKMEKVKSHTNSAKDMFLNGAKTMAKVGEYPIHLITSKEVVKYVEKPVSTIKT